MYLVYKCDWIYYLFNKELEIFLVSINILIFCFSPFKKFLQLLVSIFFSITTFDPYL